MNNFDPKKLTDDVATLTEQVALLAPLIPLVQPLLEAYSSHLAGQGGTLEGGVVIPAAELGQYTGPNLNE